LSKSIRKIDSSSHRQDAKPCSMAELVRSVMR
jgi:hypothetical protein